MNRYCFAFSKQVHLCRTVVMGERKNEGEETVKSRRRWRRQSHCCLFTTKGLIKTDAARRKGRERKSRHHPRHVLVSTSPVVKNWGRRRIRADELSLWLTFWKELDFGDEQKCSRLWTLEDNFSRDFCEVRDIMKVPPPLHFSAGAPLWLNVVLIGICCLGAGGKRGQITLSIFLCTVALDKKEVEVD